MFGSNTNLKEYNLSQKELDKLNYAKITTNHDSIWVKLHTKDTPNTVANFVSLVNDGFYNGLNFHRVIKDFMAQGGCPDGSGMGGPGWNIKCETNRSNQEHKKGSLSMAHAGKNTGGSQFFLCFVPCPHLDGQHTVFGQIEDEDSLNILDLITQEDQIVNIQILENKKND